MTNEEKKKQFEEKFFLYPEMYYFETTTDAIWDFITTALDEVRKESVEGFMDYFISTVEPLPENSQENPFYVRFTDIIRAEIKYLASKGGGEV